MQTPFPSEEKAARKSLYCEVLVGHRITGAAISSVIISKDGKDNLNGQKVWQMNLEHGCSELKLLQDDKRAIQ